MNKKIIFNSFKESEMHISMQNKISAQEHIYKGTATGASSAGGCGLTYASHITSIKLPKKNHVQKKFGAATLGTMIHELVQKNTYLGFNSKPNEYNAKFYPEVYVVIYIRLTKYDYKLTDEENVALDQAYKIITPIDLPYITPSPKGEYVIKRLLKFKNTEAVKIFKHPDAEWLQIGDIKTKSTYQFDKVINSELSWEYKCQFNSMLYETGLDWMEVNVINRDNMDSHTFVYEYDKAWMLDTYIPYLEAKLALKKQFEDFHIEDLAGIKNLKLNINNFACLIPNKTNFSWWGCPLSNNKITQKRNGKDTQKRIGLCDFAKPFVSVAVKRDWKIGEIVMLDKLQFVITGFGASGVIVARNFLKAESENVIYTYEGFWVDCERPSGKAYFDKEERYLESAKRIVGELSK